MFGLRRKKTAPDLPTLSRFSGWLRSHRADENNLFGSAATALAFPGFDPPAWSEAAKARAVAASSGYTQQLFLQPAQQRRFGGYDLARSSYYSLACDASGDDGGTLAAELRAYRDRNDDGVLVNAIDGRNFDPGMFADPRLPDGIRAVRNACIVVSIFPASRLRAAVEALAAADPAQLVDPAALAHLTDDALVHVMLLPTVAHADIDGVADLRLPETRETFFRVFRTGQEPAKDADAFFHRPYGGNIAHFWEMLPDLIAPDKGGADQAAGAVTQMIGAYLRAKGAAGLVFPSARNDSFVQFDDGRMVGFAGWNFVDFRTSPRDALNRHGVVMDPWRQDVLTGVEVERAEHGTHSGSIGLTGLAEANDAHYRAAFGPGREALMEKLRAGPPFAILYGSCNLDRIAGKGGAAI